ncbi:hypothetical protein [Kiloniella antarctica]|uniref:Lipoprotein n=1 Tax=Kiloniella antarctica TaxID=1550907 RepID=A0ABW5BIA3_9PROT
MNWSLSRLLSMLALAGVTLFGLAGCGLIEPEKAPPACPEIVVLKEAQEMTRFQGNGRDLTDVTFEASINNFVRGCILDEETNVLKNQLVVRFELNQGPASDGGAKFNYFVAVATHDRKILSRESFSLVAPFEGNRTSVAIVDNIYPSISLGRGQTGEDYIVFIGFELSRSELYYNKTKL